MPIPTKETFGKATTDVKLDLLYDCFEAVYAKLGKLENRKFIDSAKSFAGGIVGGAAAIIGLKMGGLD